MKSYLLLFCCLACLVACDQPASNENTVTVAPEIDLSGYETVTMPNGVIRAIKKDQNGKVTEEGYLANGKQNGIWTTYQDDRAHVITSYVDGILNGKKIELDHRRQIVLEETYVNGVLHGKRGTYKFGRPKLEEYYVNNVRHGPYRKFFETGKEQGKISQYADYVNGEIDGKVRHYNTDGEVTVEYTFKKGKKVSGGMLE